MAITPNERRFIRNWEEQRKGGRATFVAIYTFGYFIIIFMMAVAFALLTGLRFIVFKWLMVLSIGALVAGIVFAFWQWGRSQQKFSRIIQREIAEGSEN